MNHFISGIIKLSLLEASAALLIIDRLLGDRLASARTRAAVVVTGLMLFAWSNYGSLRHTGVTWSWVVSVALVLLAGHWLLNLAAQEPGPQTLGASLRSAWLRAGAALKFSASSSVITGALLTLTIVASAWLWVGHQVGTLRLVHEHEQFHFYLGAKYQREVGWFDLYRAALVADRQTVNVLAEARELRDNTSFEMEPVEKVLADQQRIIGRFSPERWEAFKADWVTMTQIAPMNWVNVVKDHGNSNSPAWAVVAHPIAALVPLSAINQSYLGWLDLLLMLVMFAFAFDTFGRRAGLVGLFFWAAVPFVFDYLAGSFLRWDWLFALGMAMCFMQRGQWATAGAFYGYAVATKLFPILFGVAMAFVVIDRWRTTKSIGSDIRRFAVGTVVAGLLSVGAAAAMFGVDAWSEYARRIAVTQTERFYNNQYSLKTVYLQLTHPTAGETPANLFRPREMKQARADVEPSPIGLHITRVLMTVLVFVLLRRGSMVQAFAMGPLLVFIWLTVNAYYWNMLALTAIGLMGRKERGPFAVLLGLHAVFMVLYLYQHLNAGQSEGYITAVGLACTIVVGGLLELKRLPDYEGMSKGAKSG